MGSSAVSYNKRWFWASDSRLTCWLGALSRIVRIDRQYHARSKPQWLILIGSMWGEEATSAPPGCVTPFLDAVITSQQRRDILLEYCDQALAWLHSFSPVIPAAVLNEIAGQPPTRMIPFPPPGALPFVLTGGPSTSWTEDVSPDIADRVAIPFMKLLRGEPDPIIEDMPPDLIHETDLPSS